MGILDTPALSKTQADAAYAPRGFTAARVPLVSRTTPPIVGGLSDGSVRSKLYMTRHKVMESGHSIRVAYSNIYNVNTGTEAPGINPITVYAAVSLGLPGTLSSIPVTPSGGAVIPVGKTVWFDVPFEVVKGQDVYFLTQVTTNTLGDKWPLGIQLGQGNEGFLDTSAAPTTDVTMTTTLSNITYSTSLGYGPSALIGIPSAGAVPSVLIIGDSIAYGVGSTRGEEGFINKKLIDNGVAHQQLGLSGSTGNTFSSPAKRMLRMAVIDGVYFSHCIYEYCTNDLGYTTGLRAGILPGWFTLARKGVKIYATTCVPHTSNGAGTTPGPQEAYRVEYNDWLRAGAPLDPNALTVVNVGTPGALVAGQPGHPLAGYFEVADIVESARNSGQWKTGYTTDGIHPVTSAHLAMQAAIDLTKLKL